MIELIIENQKVLAKPNQTILQAARDAGIYIPTMCYLSKCEPIGACRLCVVEVEGQNGEIAACQAKVVNGMVVKVNTNALKQSRKSIMELYCVNHPLECGVCDKSGECELQNKTLEFCVDSQNYSAKEQKRDIQNWGLIGYDPSLCIVCEKCVHVCNEVIGDDALKVYTGGYKSIITPKNGDTLDCSNCGECIAVCPVGALTSTQFKYSANAWELTPTKSSCAHCASACELFYEAKVNQSEAKIYRVTNDYETKTLCGAGRFAFDFENSASKNQSSFHAAVSAIQKADYIKFSGFITNEEASFLQAVKEKFGTKLINPWASYFKKFIQNYALTSKKDIYSASLQDALECDGAIVFGSKIAYDNPMVRYMLTNASKVRGAKIAYMHPLEEPLLRDITDLFIKYEPSSEHAVAALLAFNFCDRTKLDDVQRAYLESLDSGFLSGEASFDETEQAKVVKLMRRAKDKVLIVGADLYAHHSAGLIAMLLGLLESAAGFRVLMVPPETNSLGVAMICDLDDAANGVSVGYEEDGDFTISSKSGENSSSHLPIAALNQKHGSFVNIDKKVCDVNPALPFDGYTLADLADTLCIKITKPKLKISKLKHEMPLGDIDKIGEMNGALAYFCDDILHFSFNTYKSLNIPKTKGIIVGAKSFAQAAKASNDKDYTIYFGDNKLNVKFTLSLKMKGAIAIMSPEFPGYRFMPVVMREE